MKLKSLQRKWKLYVIHHSHTDIGYTERQEKIEQYQVDFIRQAIQICNSSHTEDRKEWKGFKWTCETFWAVEKFLEQATEEEQEQFVAALQRGDIELSGTYLNMTELVNYDLVRKVLSRAGAYAAQHGLQVRSAMTADINGYSWGYAQAMADAGIEHLLSCVHTHHGMFAIGRKQIPFYWETPKGQRILVWNGEHYMMGNDLGLNPDGALSYTIKDETSIWGVPDDYMKLAETRISRYLNQLDSEGYPYEFILLNVMGLLRDNAAPNGRVASFIQEWNAKHGEQVEIEMTTLNRYFDLLKQQDVEIPVHRGDWPDWWSDGVASTAIHTQIFRNAQRTLGVVNRLDPQHAVVDERTINEAEQQLMMYAEHTWGYHSSVREPWNIMVQELGLRKEAYSANASRAVHTALDQVMVSRGDALLSPNRPFTYKVINSFDYTVETLAHFYMEDQWEPSYFKNGLEIVDNTTGEVIPHQRDNVSRGNQITVSVLLQPFEERVYSIRPVEQSDSRTTSSTRLEGRDGIHDIANLIQLGDDEDFAKLRISENAIESRFVRIAWKAGEGITSWIDKETGQELMDTDKIHNAFTPVYEVTPAGTMEQMADVRRIMGRNRKGINVQRSIGELIGVREITNGAIYGVVELTYQIKGISYFSLFLKVYCGQPRVEVSVRMHKDSVWDPENVYISLPFSNGADSELWFEKAGSLIRPGVDQLPGTGLDFYCIQEGLAVITQGRGLLIATPDTPLMQTGDLAYGQRLVQGQQQEGDKHPLYAWVLTNYWETNFKATLGGFYEFRYTVEWGSHIDSAEKAIQICHSLNIETPTFRSK
ncbi:glycoside hydrolase [Paenibacillus sp. CF384]|uniref:glycoside hydrolase family 38 N-terminal domain-containing protein n=1 Tax=Paenibacillus sp. CF384 TaxID=1884382 RepID=UPI00089D90B8|nr:glycoside hydrolase [Paenibacillus sp. CF384]SDW76730.1 Glycosyl hydrolases family 38 N-terminal domain-containing protein [Paenibacillus sp. CF384]